MANRKINWLNHSLEFLVVLIGILIAFQLDKCSDNRAKRKLINNHLEYIKIECTENEKKLTDAIQQIEAQLNYCDSILDEIAVTKNAMKIRKYSTRLLDLRNVELFKNAYEVLIQSGDIRYLKDFELKRKVISLYNSIGKVQQINQSNQNLYDIHFYPYLKKNFDLVNWNYVDTKSERETANYSSMEFANTISTYKFLLSAKKRIYSEVQGNIKDYLNN